MAHSRGGVRVNTGTLACEVPTGDAAGEGKGRMPGLWGLRMSLWAVGLGGRLFRLDPGRFVDEKSQAEGQGWSGLQEGMKTQEPG